MPEPNENNNQENTIETVKVSIGKAKQHDENAPLADFSLSEEELDERQRAIRKTRKYGGHTSGEAEDLPLTAAMEAENVPPTDCEEPEELLVEQ